MDLMVFRFLVAMALALLMCNTAFANTEKKVQIFADGDFVRIENNRISVSFDLVSGKYKAVDKVIGKTVLTDAYAQVEEMQSTEPTAVRIWTSADINDALGKGKALTIICRIPGKPDLLLEFGLYNDKGFFTLACGIDNSTKNEFRIKRMSPLASGVAFPTAKHPALLRMLNGVSGYGVSEVTKGPSVSSTNNLMLTFLENSKRRTLVLGGLTYYEFPKFVRAAKAKGSGFEIEMKYDDPVGKLVDPGVRYLPDERTYIDLTTPSYFISLENYGLAVRAAMNARPNIYNFPTVCGWYASSSHPGCEYINNSAGMVSEMDAAIKAGFLKYSKVGVRLVPDAAGENNEQGWWDDEHWQKYGHYVEPYETTAKWAGAVLERGGIPITYVQTGLISVDFGKAHPEWFLYNDISNILTKDGKRNNDCSYDYTDPGFQEHMRKVWKNLRDGGVKGVFFDYPGTGWKLGGFEDKYATTTSAYRTIFKLAKEGLGPDSYIQERLLGQYKHQPLTDVTVGIIDSQRMWWDTHLATPDMYQRCALRWYKTRAFFQYDMDSKNFLHVKPNNRDGLRQMLTMSYMVSGRLLLATSFRTMTPEQVYDLSRIYPMHTAVQTPRPLDILNSGICPRVFDFAVDSSWHQLALFNPDVEKEAVVGVEISKNVDSGGMGLNPKKKYYAYDFWNNRFAGIFEGSGKIEQKLRPGEVRMLSVREVKSHPQVLSTDRHIMQGYVDMRDIKWDSRSKTLSGTSDVIGGEDYTIAIALNKYTPLKCEATDSKCRISKKDEKNGLIHLTIFSPYNATIKWSISFAKSK